MNITISHKKAHTYYLVVLHYDAKTTADNRSSRTMCAIPHVEPRQMYLFAVQFSAN